MQECQQRLSRSPNHIFKTVAQWEMNHIFTNENILKNHIMLHCVLKRVNKRLL